MEEKKRGRPKKENNIEKKEPIKVETRGRKPTGQKKTKNVNFRLDEATFDLYEKLSKEKAGVSVHTFLKNNIEKLFRNEKTDIVIPKFLLKCYAVLEEDEDEEFKRQMKIKKKIETSLTKDLFDRFALKFYGIENTSYFRKDLMEHLGNVFFETGHDTISLEATRLVHNSVLIEDLKKSNDLILFEKIIEDRRDFKKQVLKNKTYEEWLIESLEFEQFKKGSIINVKKDVELEEVLDNFYLKFLEKRK